MARMRDVVAVRWQAILPAALLASIAMAAPARAQGGACNVTPNPLEAIQPGTLTATGLPTAGVVALYTYFTYDGRTSGYGDTDITVSPDGTYSQPVEWEQSGKAGYRFLDDATGALLAACNVRVK
jgi:hypothetical protein